MSERDGQKCCVKVWRDYRHFLCGRWAKGTLVDGTPACGIHIAGEKRSIAHAEKRKAEFAEVEYFRKLAKELAEQVDAIAPELDAQVYTSERVMVNGHKLIEILQGYGRIDPDQREVW